MQNLRGRARPFSADLAKIEAGRLELESTDFDLGNAIDNTLVLMREREQRRGIGLGRGCLVDRSA